MKRPLGLIFTSIFLGFAGLLLVLSAAGSLLAGVLGTRTLTSPSPVPPGMLLVIFIVTALVQLLLAGWVIATLVGLLRLRNWARISVQVIGGLLVLFGGASAVIAIAIPRFLAGMPQPKPQALPPDVMHTLFLALALFYVFVAAVGVSWLVYFNFRPPPGFCNTTASHSTKTQIRNVPIQSATPHPAVACS